jgi:hypothetical protein
LELVEVRLVGGVMVVVVVSVYVIIVPSPLSPLLFLLYLIKTSGMQTVERKTQDAVGSRKRLKRKFFFQKNFNFSRITTSRFFLSTVRKYRLLKGNNLYQFMS